MSAAEVVKPTVGPWRYNPNVERGGTISADAVGMRIALICAPTGGRTDETDANALLIAEAGTVLHETGMSPWQLVEINASLGSQNIALANEVERLKEQRETFLVFLHTVETARGHMIEGNWLSARATEMRVALAEQQTAGER